MRDLNLNTIAKNLGVSRQAAERIVSSTRIYTEKKEGSEDAGSTFDVGLRVMRKQLDTELCPELKEENIFDYINKYSAECPAVYNWLCSGAFVNDKLPETVKIAQVIHACRTAGRLRAEIIRNAGE